VRMAPAIAALLLASSVHAEPSAWTMSPEGSEIAFTATFENAPARGVFRKFDVSLRIDPDKPAAGRLDVTIAVPTAEMGSDDIDETIRGAEWFDASRFPVAEFHAAEVRRVAPDRYVADGTLTIKGISKPLAVPFDWKPSGNGATITGDVAVDRSTYNIGTGEWRSTKQIGGEVQVRFTVRLRKVP